MRRIPLKEKITEDLRQKINDGVYEPGQMLPSLRTLAAEYEVSTAPVRNAIDRLLLEGLVTVVQRSGTYVSLPEDS